jgi:hypothetical protein
LAVAALVILLPGRLPAAAEAVAPAWTNDAYAGLDKDCALAGLGQSDFFPEVRISSAVAYAYSVRKMSESLADIISMQARSYSEDAGSVEDSAVKDLVRSPLGSALTKTYGDAESDDMEMTIAVRRLDDDNVRVYAQEYPDAAARTLHVRTVMSQSTVDYLIFAKRYGASEMEIMASTVGKLQPSETSDLVQRFKKLKVAMATANSALEGRLGDGFAVWKGGNLRLDSREIRAGKHSEDTLFVEDKDLGLGWIERWPSGGADLMKGGEVVAQYTFNKRLKQWVASPGAQDPR